MAISLGAAREIITPILGGLLAGYGSGEPSASVHDDLTVTAFALESDKTKILLLSVSVCLINGDICEKLRERCGEASGIPADHVIVSATHTHTGPVMPDAEDEYCKNILFPGCIKASEAAAGSMKPVIMGIAATKSKVGVNRRQLLADDTVILGQNPWGPYDPEMTVISFRGREGKPAANLIHCTAHNTACGTIPVISRDWCGVMIDRLETESGAVTAFFNGCAGDVAPRMANGKSTGDIAHAMEAGAVAGMDAVRAYKDIRGYTDTDMDAVTGDIRIPYEPIKPLEAARREYAAIEHSAARFDGGIRNLLLQIMEMHEKGDTGPADFTFKQTLIRVGPAVLVPFPFEPSSEISLRLRTYSPFGYTLALGYTNGSNSYLPTQDQICRGGYEIERFQSAKPRQLPVNTDTHIINANIELMKKFKH